MDNSLTTALILLVSALLTTPLWKHVAQILKWYAFLRAMRNRRKQNILTLGDICYDIGNRPLAHQRATAVYYVGVVTDMERVCLTDLQEDVAEGSFALTMVLCKGIGRSAGSGHEIHCSVPRECHPWLSGAKRGCTFWIAGRIADAGSKHIQLSEVSLQFDKCPDDPCLMPPVPERVTRRDSRHAYVGVGSTSHSNHESIVQVDRR
jgi:hypothetical protein